MKKITKVFFVFLLLFFGTTVSAMAENGVSASRIILGQSCALSGPAIALGTGMRAGLNAYFSKINATGGINGRQVKLISKDDGYEPQKAINNTHALLEQDKVFLLIGEVGTPTSKAVFPIIEKSDVPFFGPFTGAEFLRNPFKKQVINVRASYYQEMEKLAAYLVDQKKFTNIACFYQNDGYGQAGLKGIERALKKRSMKLSAMGTYERNTTAVKSGLLQIRKAHPDAIVMVGAYKPCAAFIKLAKKVGMTKTVFCNISFVGTKALKKALGPDGEGCIVSQVVPYPWDESIPLVKEYTSAMHKFQPNGSIGFVSLEGYMVGKLFCLAGQTVKGELTRTSLLQAIEQTGSFDLGGITLNFGPHDHQGMDKVFLTMISAGEIKPL